MKKKLIAFIILSMISMPITVSAENFQGNQKLEQQEEIVPYATSWKLNIPRVQQAKSNWCWAAAAQMAGTYYTTSTRTQYDVVSYMKGTSLPNVTGSVADVVNSIKYASSYQRGATSSTGAYPFSTIQSIISTNKAVVVRMDWGKQVGHIVVLGGYNVTGKTVYVIDPAVGTSPREYSYEAMKINIKLQSGTGKISHSIRVTS